MVLDAVEHYGTAVFVGGAMVIDTQRHVTLHRMLMEPSLAAQVCAVLEAHGHAALALQDTAHAGVDYLVTEQIEVNESTRRWMDLTRASIRRVPNLATHSHEHTVRVGIVAAPEEIEIVRAALEKRFGPRVFFQSIFVPAQRVQVLEVFDPSVNKWEGVLHVARRHGIMPQEIIAIGDDVNDIHMIANAGLGVAMGNARDEIKSIAQRVIGSNREDGLAAFLEEIVESHLVTPMDDATRGADAA